MNILVVESYLRTRSWIKALLGIARVNLYFVVVIPNEKKYLLKNGVLECNILDLSKFKFKKGTYKEDINFLRNFEKKIDININEIILMDRILSKKSERYAFSYLSFIANEICTFVKKNKIKIIFQEETWAHEILIANIYKKSCIAVYVPHTLRLPYERFLFFKNFSQKEYYERNLSYNSVKKIAEDVYDSVTNKNYKPAYFYINNQKNHIKIIHIKKLFIQIFSCIVNTRSRLVTPSLVTLVYRKLLKCFRASYLKICNLFVSMENIDFSFILVTLHVQPEASIDVLASKYSNQIEFVRSIARTTPVSHKVLVKEHSNALGDRSYSFYKKLASIPRVTLVDPNIDSHYLIKSADLVISATGTASFEAAVLGTPAVTASEMFFSHLMVQKKFNPYVDDVKDLIQTGYLWKKKYSKEMIVAGMVKILRNSFEGDTTDILSNPNVVKKKNIHLLEKAFKELIANHEMK